MKSLQGRVALVTGSSSGIGQAIAEKLAHNGANIVINYVGHREGAEETLQQVEAHGVQGLIVNADVSKLADVQALIDRSWESFGSVDILVNNAGLEKKADFWDVTEEDYDRVLGVNLKGPFFSPNDSYSAFGRRRKSGGSSISALFMKTWPFRASPAIAPARVVCAC